MTTPLTILLIAASGAFFSYRRLFRYLQILQQDEYSPERFLRWFADKQAFDTRGSLVAIVFLLLGSWIEKGWLLLLLSAIAGLIIIISSVKEPNPLVEGKIKLTMTERARRIFHGAFFLYLIAMIVAVAVFLLYRDFIAASWFWGVQLLLFQITPLCLLGAVYLLEPYEKWLQRHYLQQAKELLEKYKPFIIGITGSYGKTSTKNALGELLAVTLDATFWPPGGINTLMGNVRAIREELSPSHKYAIIEMAAYRAGSIARLCQLAPPQAAIITAIGLMHLDRFGGQDQIYQAKTELAAAVPPSGILVCNGDDPNTRRAAKEFSKQTTLLYGFDTSQTLDCSLSQLKLTPEGTQFKLDWKKKSYSGSVPLFGKPALMNMMAAVSMACSLGADPEMVVAALTNLRPVDNRLAVEKQGTSLWIKDAYNSNPIGFLAALEILRDFPGNRKILMTPGMIELGQLQFSENKRIAQEAANLVDLVLLVGETNKTAWQEGLAAGGLQDYKVLFFEHRDQALKKLLGLQQNGDVILVENDLPDWFEDKAVF